MTENTNIQPPEQAPESEPDKKKKKKRRPLWARILIWLGAAVTTVALLIALVISLIVWILTPEKLTPLVNKYASEYLIADVNARRVELTFWHTFPRFSVDVDSLEITSRALRDLPDSVRATLPADADSLLFIKRFSGGINLAALAKGDISIYDVDLCGTRANLVQVDSLRANYLIMPPSEEETPEKKETAIPNISINSFTIADGLVARFRIPADSLDCTLGLHRAQLADSSSHGQPLYTLTATGDAAASLAMLKIPSTPFGIDGNIQWESKKPMQIGLSDFRLRVGEVEAKFSTRIDMTDDLTVHEFTADIPEVSLMKIIELVPEEYAEALKPLDTDLSLQLKAKLLKPYIVSSPELPSAEISFKADAKRLVFGRLNLSRLKFDMDARVDLANPDASHININAVEAMGKAMDFKLKASIDHPVSDPSVQGNFEGTLTVQNLPQQLLEKLPCAIRGTLRGKAEVKTRLSYLSPKLFHKAKIDGEITLDDFRMAMTDGTLDSYIRHGAFKFGSSSSITVKDHLIDSMLTASLTIDTMALATPEMTLSGRELSAGVGARNIRTSSDTSQINPIGATIHAERIMLRSDSDSIRVRLRDARISASLQRYEGKGRSPLLKATVNSGAIMFADRYNRAILRDGQASFTVHPKSRPVMSARRQARFDSLAMLHPDLSADSVIGLMRKQARQAMAEYDRQRLGREDITVDLDKPMRNLLLRWNASGSLKARRVRVFTPYFPSRNTLTGLDLTFSTDSIVLAETKLRIDNSDFTLNGAIHNLRRALTSRHGSPYKLDFNVKSDTIDVNHLMATMIRGAVFADKVAAGVTEGMSDNESEELLQRQLDSQLPDTARRTAVLIPSNITANFSLHANHVLYSNLWLHGLDGLVEIYDGALNLDRLKAYTNIGAVNFSALYSAPTADALSLAAAVRIKRLNLRSVLDMMPQIDSLLPLLGEVRGIVDADMALTTELDSLMDLRLNTLNLALKISGDSLQLLDNETFRTIAKWMLFKKKDRNLIDHMDVELAIHDGFIDLYPFIFDMDRYRLGVRGSNDANFNLNYHVAVIKSPIPFKFGINIKGTPEKMKIRLGKARINEKTVAESRRLTDTVRVNLINEITQAFRRGIRSTGMRGLRLNDGRTPGSGARNEAAEEDRFTHADSIVLIQQGLIERPTGFIMPGDTIKTEPAPAKKKKKKK